MEKIILDYHPSFLKKTIEAIEIIPANKLGIILTQNNMGFCRLHFYKEAFKNAGALTMTMLRFIFNEFEHEFSWEETRFDSSDGNSSKREILDYLNVRYLMLYRKNEFKGIVNASASIFGVPEFVMYDEHISTCTKSVLLNAVSFKEYEREALVDEKRKVTLKLVSEVFKKEKKAEYDFTLFSSFNKNFKPWLNKKKK